MNVKKLRAKMVELDINMDQLAKCIGKSKSFLYRIFKDDGKKLEIGYCIQISKYLKLTKDEINEIFFADIFA